MSTPKPLEELLRESGEPPLRDDWARTWPADQATMKAARSEMARRLRKLAEYVGSCDTALDGGPILADVREILEGRR